MVHQGFNYGRQERPGKAATTDATQLSARTLQCLYSPAIPLRYDKGRGCRTGLRDRSYG